VPYPATTVRKCETGVLVCEGMRENTDSDSPPISPVHLFFLTYFLCGFSNKFLHVALDWMQLFDVSKRPSSFRVRDGRVPVVKLGFAGDKNHQDGKTFEVIF